MTATAILQARKKLREEEKSQMEKTKIWLFGPQNPQNSQKLKGIIRVQLGLEMEDG